MGISGKSRGTTPKGEKSSPNKGLVWAELSLLGSPNPHFRDDQGSRSGQLLPIKASICHLNDCFYVVLLEVRWSFRMLWSILSRSSPSLVIWLCSGTVRHKVAHLGLANSWRFGMPGEIGVLRKRKEISMVCDGINSTTWGFYLLQWNWSLLCTSEMTPGSILMLVSLRRLKEALEK